MIPKRVDDIHFGEIKVKYGKNLNYEWEIEDMVFEYTSTRKLTSQLQFRDKYLEKKGIALLPISNEAWTLIINKAYSTVDVQEESVLEDLWLRRVAQFLHEKRTKNQSLISDGFVYETNTGYVFTKVGLSKYLRNFSDMKIFTNEWHSEKVLTLLNCKASSVTLKKFKGRAVKLNKYASRVDERLYEYLEEFDEPAVVE